MAGKEDEKLEIAEELSEQPEVVDPNFWPHRKEIIDNQPKFWAEICHLAGLLTDNIILRIWLLIEFVNGWRRQNEPAN